jgi:hypothetical protein
MSLSRLAALSALAALAAACGPEKPRTPAGAQAVAPAPPPAPASSYVVAAVTLRKEPQAADRIPGPGGKPVTNYLPVTLQRGERVVPLEAKEDWQRVRASDDSEGWLRAGVLLDGAGVTEATVLAPADVFDRPDLLAANPKRRLDPGTLLLVVKARAPFSEVNVPGAQNAWVLTERLVTTPREVGVAKLCEKARWLAKAEKRDEALQILALAKGQFPDVPLLKVLEDELGAPAGGEPPKP